jgi:hypothetical protein
MVETDALSSEQWGCRLSVSTEGITGTELVGATSVIRSSLSPRTSPLSLIFLEDNAAVVIFVIFTVLVFASLPPPLTPPPSLLFAAIAAAVVVGAGCSCSFFIFTALLFLPPELMPLSSSSSV